MISYIVSVYDRLTSLNACIASLETQENPGQIIICYNGPGDPWIRMPHGACRLLTGNMGADGCYESAEMAMAVVEGDWLCFPSDDSLYVADFSKIMIETAVKYRADLVYCDMVYKCGSEVNGWKPYSVLSSEPRMSKIDKTNFIIRRELFKGFPPHPRGWRDGALIEQVIRDGARPAKAPGVLVLHQ